MPVTLQKILRANLGSVESFRIYVLQLTPETVLVVYNCFLWKVVRQSHNHVTKFCIQFEKIGRGLLREAFRNEEECLVG